MSHSDEFFNGTVKNPWNQTFMQADDNEEPKAEEYKISASLKTIWNGTSDDITNSSQSNANSSRNSQRQQTQRPNFEYVQFGNNVIAIENVQSHPVRIFGTGSSRYNVVSNNVHARTNQKRAITSRNGSHVTHFGNENNENWPNGSVLAGLSSPPPHLQQELQEQLQLHLQQQLQRQQQQHQSQQLEQFLQQVQVIVRNGFLDRRILTEPIPPETFDLVQMLIFYVIEYGKAKGELSADETKMTLYKIGLIQNEITRSQWQHMRQNRAQQEILSSFASFERQPNFTIQPPVQTNSRNPWPNASHTETSNQANESQRQFDSRQFEHRQFGQQQFDNRQSGQRQSGQRQSVQRQFDQRQFDQRQFDRYASQSSQPSASSSVNFRFLATAKNTDKHSQ